MAYYTPSYSDLGRHRKTKRLMRALGVAMPATMGHLHLFWHWVLEFAPNGDISFDRFTCEDIADGALWEGDAYAFLEALVTAGFVDRNDDRLAVHEWHEYGGAYFEKLERDRERKRNKGNPEESPVVPAASDGVPMERAGIPRNSTEFPQKNRKEKEENREEEKRKTLATDKPPRVEARPRPRNVIFDALVEACEYESDGLTENDAVKIGKAASQIRAAGGTPEDVRLRAGRYVMLYGMDKLTPLGLASNWGKLAREPTPATNGKHPTPIRTEMPPLDSRWSDITFEAKRWKPGMAVPRFDEAADRAIEALGGWQQFLFDGSKRDAFERAYRGVPA